MTKSKSFLHHFIKQFSSNSKSGNEEDELERIAATEQKHFSFDTLVKATQNFDPSSKLGQGGFGPVYKGKLDDGREIAVKKLSQSSRQGKREFFNEAKLLARVQHRNVVNLLGYCMHGVDKLLVYEYVVNESLDKLLFRSERADKLDWKTRHAIIKGIVKGLLYLHEDAPTCIIHRDIKASNILLDEKWVAKIADFGMARLYPEDETYVHTRIAGTNGYMAPEYVMHGRLSVKADVFSFGVVVLELISGQKNSNFDRDPECQGLLDWAFKLYKRGKSLEIMESVLASSAIPDEVQLCVHIGLLCTQSDPQLRPDMRRVLVILSKRPGSLEEPTRPGNPGTRYRRSREQRGSVSSSSGTSGDFNSRTIGSTTGTNTSTASASTSAVTGPVSDRHRRSREQRGSVSSSTGTSGDFNSRTIGSTTGTNTSTASASTSAVTGPVSDRHRRSREQQGPVSSSSATSGDLYSRTIGSTTGTNTATASASTPAVTGPVPVFDRHGKRPVEG